MRASECTHSMPYRPLSHSHPWFTGSESTPNNRTKRFDDDCSAPRHCTAQVTHEVSAVARSHGRARKRYWLAVNAPTGQICTVLPEKYESNGWSAKFSTCVRSLRSTKSINGSPAISSAKRVHRAHWMQRSRSSRISSLRRIGFSQWRFSSTKRDSPGPKASVWSWSGHSPPRSQTGQSSGWLMSKNSRTPSWIFFTVSDCVWHTMPSVTGVVQAGGKPRTPSTSTRHMRHMPTGCMRSCQQKRGM